MNVRTGWDRPSRTHGTCMSESDASAVRRSRAGEARNSPETSDTLVSHPVGSFDRTQLKERPLWRSSEPSPPPYWP